MSDMGSAVLAHAAGVRRPSRRRLLVAGLILSVAGIGAGLGTTLGLSASGPPAPGASPHGAAAARTINLSDLGVTVQVPAAWVAFPARGPGYEYRFGGSGDYVLAGRLLGTAGLTFAQVAAERTSLLSAEGSRPQSRLTAIGGRQALRLAYMLRRPGAGSPSLVSVEYDIDDSGHDYVMLVVGVGPSGGNADLVSWVAAHLR